MRRGWGVQGSVLLLLAACGGSDGSTDTATSLTTMETSAGDTASESGTEESGTGSTDDAGTGDTGDTTTGTEESTTGDGDGDGDGDAAGDGDGDGDGDAAGDGDGDGDGDAAGDGDGDGDGDAAGDGDGDGDGDAAGDGDGDGDGDAAGDGDGDGDGDAAGDGDGDGDGDAAGDGDGDGDGDAAGDGDGDGDGDAAGDGDGDGDGDGAVGCEKVDFLFVIDNSVSMGAEQTALTAAFPEFMNAIQNTLTATSYHIMVADTDAETRCTPSACAGSPHQTCGGSNGYACTASFDACDSVRGAGVVHPAGNGASNQLCTPFGGNRYIVDGEPDLSGTFSCMATVGLAGHPSERPMDGIVEAISDPLNDPGGCNDGFLRDDAILVVTFISDDPNVEDVNSAMDTYNAIIAAKNGDTDATVVLGLIPNPSNGCVTNNPTAGDHWRDLISMFGAQGIEGEVCDSDYAPFFQSAVSIIENACIINPQ